VIALFVLALVLFGGDWFISTTPDEVTFSYQRIGTGDEYDQVLTIKNDGFGAVAPKLKITPLDSANQPISGVKVTSAFGSVRGTQVVPPFFTEYDILKFEGERADEVWDVKVEIDDLKQVDHPQMPEGGVVVKRYLNEGKPANEFEDPFDAIELHNPNPDDITVEIALMAWKDAKQGEPQQFEWVITTGAPVTVPGEGNTTVQLGPDTAGISYVTVQTYSATS